MFDAFLSVRHHISASKKGVRGIEKLCEKYRRNLIAMRKYQRLKDYKRLRYTQGEQKRIRGEVEKFIDDIEDPVIRLILYERIIRGRSWQSVANILGGGNTADGVRMKQKRYFRHL